MKLFIWDLITSEKNGFLDTENFLLQNKSYWGRFSILWVTYKNLILGNIL